MSIKEIIKNAKKELETITNKYSWGEYIYLKNYVRELEYESKKEEIITESEIKMTKTNKTNPLKSEIKKEIITESEVKMTKKCKTKLSKSEIKESKSLKYEIKESEPLKSEIKESEPLKTEMKESEPLKSEMKEIKLTKSKKNTEINKISLTEKKINIVIIKNPMLNYMSENAYKIACCLNYEENLKKKLNNFIEPCNEIYNCSLSKIVNEELLNNITTKNIQNVIMKIFEGDMIIDFRHNYMGTIILTEEELFKKIKKMESEITILENYTPIENLKIENKKIKKNGEIFELLTKEKTQKILKLFEYLLKTKSKYKLMAYTCEIFNYYGPNIWCVEICRGSCKTPETAITLISEFMPNMKIYEFNNYKESECYDAYNLLIFLLIYNNQNMHFNPNNEQSIFFKCENIDDMFENIKNLSNIINQSVNEMTRELLKIYPRAIHLF